MASTLLASPGMTCRLAFYREDAYQPPHSHSLPVISMIFTGSVREEVGGCQEVADTGCLPVKPPEVRHSDAYGRNGVLLLSVVIDDPILWAEAVQDEEWRWAKLCCRQQAEIVSLFGRANTADAVFELLALAARAERPAEAPPAWLLRIAERLADDPDVLLGSLAAEGRPSGVSFAGLSALVC